MKIFISSTTKSLSDTRNYISNAIANMGYTPILFENGDILYSPNQDIFKDCLVEVKEADMLIVVIDKEDSVCLNEQVYNILDIKKLKQKSKDVKIFDKPELITITYAEVFTAILNEIPIYVFINDSVEHTYSRYKDNTSLVKNDELVVCRFIDYITGMYMNNSYHKYSNAEEIVDRLMIQWTQLFKKLLDKEKDILCGCNADWYVVEKQSKDIQNKDINSNDSSNLFFILLSVKDCVDARQNTRFIKDNNFDKKIVIEAMYDILGSWDLIIKFRSDEINANLFYKKIIDKLILERLIDENKNSIFGRRKFINVISQGRSIQTVRNNNPEIITYTLLKDNDSYDSYRVNRSFIFVELPIDDDEKRNFISHLTNDISNKMGTEIIESVCECKYEIIFETFSSCSRTNFISKLNKLIDPVIAIYGLQKYTLTCYYHDEFILSQVEDIDIEK